MAGLCAGLSFVVRPTSAIVWAFLAFTTLLHAGTRTAARRLPSRTHQTLPDQTGSRVSSASSPSSSPCGRVRHFVMRSVMSSWMRRTLLSRPSRVASSW